MIESLLLLLAGGALELGTSPLVQPGHVHRWTKAEEDGELTSWIDEAWRGETVIDGVRYKQLLLRTQAKDEELLVVDLIAVVDCANAKMGMQRVIIIKPDMGPDAEMPVDGLQMNILDTSGNSGDQLLFKAACDTGGAR